MPNGVVGIGTVTPIGEGGMKGYVLGLVNVLVQRLSTLDVGCCGGGGRVVGKGIGVGGGGEVRD